MMGTGFKRHIGRSAAGLFAGHGKGLTLGMRASANRCDSGADNGSVGNNHTADRRIGQGLSQMTATKPNRRCHEPLIIRLFAHHVYPGS